MKTTTKMTTTKTTTTRRIGGELPDRWSMPNLPLHLTWRARNGIVGGRSLGPPGR
jgi:hypothetical protein